MKNWVPVHSIDPMTGRMTHDPREERQIEYDREAFACTDVGCSHAAQQAMIEYFRSEPMGEEALTYWAGKELKKQLYDVDRDEGRYAWSVFTPSDVRLDKRYALLYISHGGGQPIGFSEHYGFNALAAAERFITVYPMNGGLSNEEVDTEFPRIVNALREKGYPIDWERVYCVGFSSGSEATVCAACTIPEKVAAIAVLPGGQPFKDLEFYKGWDYYSPVKGLRIPGCFIGGTVDVGNFPAPWILDDSMKRRVEQPTTEQRVENLNVWMREIAQVKNAAQIDLQTVTDALTGSDSPVEREFGLRFDREFSFRAEGCDWLGGEFYGEDGAPVMRLARAIGVPHIVWDSQVNLAWDYLKHFRRDLRDGSSNYDVMACWGER